MTKKALVERIISGSSMSHREAERMVELVLDALKASIKNGETITIRLFGTFGLKSLPARECRNPGTGEKINVPARQRPYWKPSKDLLGN